MVEKLHLLENLLDQGKIFSREIFHVENLADQKKVIFCGTLPYIFLWRTSLIKEKSFFVEDFQNSFFFGKLAR